MAYLEGETLQRKLARGPLEVAQAVEIAFQIASSGPACAHGLGIVHRDIKSANIMVDRGGHVSIMRFPDWRCRPTPCASPERASPWVPLVTCLLNRLGAKMWTGAPTSGR